MRAAIDYIHIKYGAITWWKFGDQLHEYALGNVANSLWFGDVFYLHVFERECLKELFLLAQMHQYDSLLHPEKPCFEAPVSLPLELAYVCKYLNETVVQEVLC